MIVTPSLFDVAFNCKLSSVPTAPPVEGNSMLPKRNVPETFRPVCVSVIV